VNHAICGLRWLLRHVRERRIEEWRIEEADLVIGYRRSTGPRRDAESQVRACGASGDRTRNLRIKSGHLGRSELSARTQWTGCAPGKRRMHGLSADPVSTPVSTPPLAECLLLLRRVIAMRRSSGSGRASSRPSPGASRCRPLPRGPRTGNTQRGDNVGVAVPVYHRCRATHGGKKSRKCGVRVAPG
jgi:hypothetical protein